jgi:hypothetical protein
MVARLILLYVINVLKFHDGHKAQDFSLYNLSTKILLPSVPKMHSDFFLSPCDLVLMCLSVKEYLQIFFPEPL